MAFCLVMEFNRFKTELEWSIQYSFPKEGLCSCIALFNCVSVQTRKTKVDGALHFSSLTSLAK